jgi:hypothetical protein
MRWALVPIAALFLAFIPSAALAQSPERNDDFTLRINGDVSIAAGDRVNSVVVIDGNLTVDGEVTDFVLVIKGDATINGTVGGDLTVINGDINLASSAVVDNVNSVRGNINRAQGATITGDIHERDNFRFLWAAAGLFSVLFWIAMTIAMVAAALIFAAFGGRQLASAARAMTGDVVNTIIGAVFFWIGVPILAFLAIVTVIGIPIGIGLILFLLPTIGFLGYLISGTRLGTWLLGLGGREAGERPFLAAALGTLVLQLLVLIPVIGIVIAIVAGIWGGGALAFRIYRGAGGKGFENAEAVTLESRPSEA